MNLVGDEVRVNFETGGAGPKLRLANTGNLIITGGYPPDYVFEPDNELMSLDELASFISRGRQLPKVAYAAEVQRNGLYVSTFPGGSSRARQQPMVLQDEQRMVDALIVVAVEESQLLLCWLALVGLPEACHSSPPDPSVGLSRRQTERETGCEAFRCCGS